MKKRYSKNSKPNPSAARCHAAPKTKPKCRRLGGRIPVAVASGLDALARRQGKSRAAIIREAAWAKLEADGCAVTIQVPFSKDEMKRIRLVSKRYRISPSEIVCRAVEHILPEWERSGVVAS